MALLLSAFGLLVGLSLALQGCIQQVLRAVGFRDAEGGVANSSYNIAAALVGMGLGGRLQSARALGPALRSLHAVAACSYGGLAAVCFAMRALGGFELAAPLMIACTAMLGTSLMGMLPFVMQRACDRAGASENVVASLLYILAMPVAATLTAITSRLSGAASIGLVGGLLVLELLLFAIADGGRDRELDGPLLEGGAGEAACPAPRADVGGRLEYG